MFSHIFTSVTDFDRALTFYTAVMDSLGLEQRFCDRQRPWAGWHSAQKSRPFFVVCTPHDQQPHHPGNGQMVAFTADTRAVVRAVHAAALTHGGVCEGPPGLREQYHPHYFGAYFRDPDGNKLAVACHADEDG